jgi:hypothetical protein
MQDINLFDLVGVAGISLILLGFYRTSFGKWSTHSFWYELDNLVGAILLVIYSLHHHAYISVILDTIWAIVALRGITSLKERRLRARQKKKHRR